jgi:hypothetical protein
LGQAQSRAARPYGAPVAVLDNGEEAAVSRAYAPRVLAEVKARAQ